MLKEDSKQIFVIKWTYIGYQLKFKRVIYIHFVILQYFCFIVAFIIRGQSRRKTRWDRRRERKAFVLIIIRP